MRVILTENQLRLLSEDLKYTEGKINEILLKGRENLRVIRNWHNKYKNIIFSLTINDVVENYDKYNGLLDQIKLLLEQLNRKVDEYYHIIELYDNMDRPDTIREIEDIAVEMQDIGYQIDDFKDILKDILFFSKNHLK